MKKISLVLIAAAFVVSVNAQNGTTKDAKATAPAKTEKATAKTTDAAAPKAEKAKAKEAPKASKTEKTAAKEEPTKK